MPALIVLAAGASRRLGVCKALVELGGEPALLRLLRAARALGEARPLVVTGAHHELIAQAVGDHPVDLLFNPDWPAGRTGGLRAAARQRAGRDLCVAPIDCPLVAAGTFARLARGWHEAGRPARGWLAPRLVPAPANRSPYGHPVLVGHDLAAELAGMDPGDPLRRLRSRARPLTSLPVDDPAVLDDLDTPEDLKILRARERDPASGRPQ